MGTLSSASLVEDADITLSLHTTIFLACLLTTSGSVDLVIPQQQDSVNLDIPNDKGVDMQNAEYEERHMPPYKRPEPPKPDDDPD